MCQNAATSASDPPIIRKRVRSFEQSHGRSFSSSSAQHPSATASTSASATPHEQSQIISYITDVEGDAAYLDRYVKISKVLQFILTEPRKMDQQRKPSDDVQGDFSSVSYFPYDHCMDFLEQPNNDDNNESTISQLVYGGDVWDKGGSDLYVIRQLLDLKRRYPDRVHFLMGNRDINKMRIPQEMGLHDDDNDKSSSSNTQLPRHDGVYWLRNFHQASGGDPDDDSIAPPSTSASDRLRWMLARTMGSPKAFELRRLELQREKRAAALEAVAGVDDKISDEEVVQSYRQSCHPRTGELGNYLAHAHLALRIGELLVVHGALPLTTPILRQVVTDNKSNTSSEVTSNVTSRFWTDLTFAMPWIKNKSGATNPGTAKQSIDSWIAALGDFAKRSLSAWKASADRIGAKSQEENSNEQTPEDIWALRGGYPPEMLEGQLMQYGMGWTPDGKNNPTAVYASWVVDGMPKRFFPKGMHGDHTVEDDEYVQLVEEFFRQSELRLILAGHQPQGDMPLPIRIEYEGGRDATKSTTGNRNSVGWVLCCDTSYSGDTKWFHSSHSEHSGDERENPGRGQHPGFRGEIAVSETLVSMNKTDQILDVRWHGVLNDGTTYESSSLPFSCDTSDETDGSIGTLSQGDWVPKEEDTPHNTRWWTKAHLDDESTLLTTAKGYDVHNCIVQRPHKSR